MAASQEDRVGVGAIVSSAARPKRRENDNKDAARDSEYEGRSGRPHQISGPHRAIINLEDWRPNASVHQH